MRTDLSYSVVLSYLPLPSDFKSSNFDLVKIKYRNIEVGRYHQLFLSYARHPKLSGFVLTLENIFRIFKLLFSFCFAVKMPHRSHGAPFVYSEAERRANELLSYVKDPG